MVMYLNQVPPQYSAVVLSPTAAIDPTTAAVLNYRQQQQHRQLLWLKQRHIKEQRFQSAGTGSGHDVLRDAEWRPSSADVTSQTEETQTMFEMNRLQMTVCPFSASSIESQSLTAQGFSSGGVEQKIDSCAVTTAPTTVRCLSSVSFSSFYDRALVTSAAHRGQTATEVYNRATDVVASTPGDSMMLNDNRSIYCTREALEQLLGTGNYIACHVIPSNGDVSNGREGAYSEINLTENPYQTVVRRGNKDSVGFEGVAETNGSNMENIKTDVDEKEVGAKIDGNTVNDAHRFSRSANDEDDNGDYDGGNDKDDDGEEYQDVKNVIYGRQGRWKHLKNSPEDGAGLPQSLDTSQTTVKSTFPSQLPHPPSQPCTFTTLSPCSSPTSSSSAIFSPCIRSPLELATPTASFVSYYHQTPAITAKVSPITSPQTSLPYPIVLIKTLPNQLTTDKSPNQSVTQNAFALRLDHAPDVEEASKKKELNDPPSYSSVCRGKHFDKRI